MLEFSGITSDEFIEYKGRPIVRQGEEIYYGDMSEKYYVYMLIMSENPSPNGDFKIPDTILVQLIDSNTKKPEKQKITSGFAEAFEFAEAWIRYNDRD